MKPWYNNIMEEGDVTHLPQIKEIKVKVGDLVNIFIDNCNPGQGIVIGTKEEQSVNGSYYINREATNVKYAKHYSVLKEGNLRWYFGNELEKIETSKG